MNAATYTGAFIQTLEEAASEHGLESVDELHSEVSDLFPFRIHDYKGKHLAEMSLDACGELAGGTDLEPSIFIFAVIFILLLRVVIHALVGLGVRAGVVLALFFRKVTCNFPGVHLTSFRVFSIVARVPEHVREGMFEITIRYVFSSTAPVFRLGL